MAQETQNEQQKLNATGNAISVTAALMATIGFSALLAEPFETVESSRRRNIPDISFVLFAGLSFLLALTAIVLSLLPTMHLGQQSVFRELEQTRKLVAFAMAFLWACIFCVLIAFGISYGALARHTVTRVGAAVGVSFCLVAMTLLIVALVKNFLPNQHRKIVGRFYTWFPEKNS